MINYVHSKRNLTIDTIQFAQNTAGKIVNCKSTKGRKRKGDTMKKRILSVLLSAAMVATLLVGCGGSSEAAAPAAAPVAEEKTEEAAAPAAEEAPAASTNENELTVWCWDKAFNIYAMETAAEIYKKDHPDFNLVVTEISWDDLQTKMGTIVGSGDYSQLPDILLMQDFAYQKYTTIYSDLFQDITDSGIDFSQFASGKLENSVVDGKNYGVPFDNGAEVAAYRTDILEEAGYTIDDMTDIDWTRFQEIGEDVLAKTGYSLFSVQAGSADYLMQILQSEGEGVWNSDGTPNIAGNDKIKAAFEVYKNLADSGVMSLQNNWDEYIASFTSGKTCGTINGAWILASVQTAEDQSGKWAVTNMPKMPGGTNYSNQGGSTWAVTTNCNNVELATDFLAATFAGSKELYETILPSSGAISTWAPAGDSDVYAQPQEFFGGQAIYADIVEFATKVPVVKFGVFHTEANDALATAVTNYVNGGDLDAELQAAQETVEFAIQ